MIQMRSSPAGREGKEMTRIIWTKHCLALKMTCWQLHHWDAGRDCFLSMKINVGRKEEDTKSVHSTSLIQRQVFIQKCVRSTLFGISVTHCILILNAKDGGDYFDTGSECHVILFWIWQENGSSLQFWQHGHVPEFCINKKKGVSIELLVLCALRWLGWGWTIDDPQENAQINVETIGLFLHHFVVLVVVIITCIAHKRDSFHLSLNKNCISVLLQMHRHYQFFSKWKLHAGRLINELSNTH